MLPIVAMKSLAEISLIVSVCILGPACGGRLSPQGQGHGQSVSLGSDLSIRPVATGAFEVTHTFPWPANSLLVEMRDGTLVLAGTPYTPEATARVLEWAKARFGSRPIIAIDNGYHVDNLGGNAALRAAGVAVYGSDLTVRLLSERGEKMRHRTLEMIGDARAPSYAVHASLAFVPPDHVFPVGEGLLLRLGDEEVRVIYPGPSQAPDKVAVYFPSRKLLYGGCMILSGEKAGNIADADLDSWPRAVTSLLALPVTVVIPGHGDRTDAGLIQHTLDVLAQIPRPGR